MLTKELIVSDPQADILESSQQVNLFMAGQGSGKTHCEGLLSANFINSYPNARGLIAANTYDQLNRTTMFKIREVWKADFGWEEFDENTPNGCYVVGRQPPKHFNTTHHNYDRYNNIISFQNGAVIYIGSLDNYKALDGMEIAWALLDETKDTKEEAVKEVILGRLRQKGIVINGVDFNPLYIFTSPAKVAWINEFFKLVDFEIEINRTIFSETTYFKKTFENKLVVISSSYHNAHNLPQGFIERQKMNIPSYLQDMLIYGSPFAKTGGEFYKCFDQNKHVLQEKIPYDPSLPLHISLDENVNPYLPLTIWQLHGKKAVLIDEICQKTPNNTIVKLCDAFKAKYPNHTAGLFIYGDATSKKQDVKIEKGHNFYTLIEKELKAYRPIRRVPSRNPSVVMRGMFINQILESNFAGIEIAINRHCANTIADLIYIKEDKEGKLKENVTDPVTKVSYQKYGHFSDSLDYFICEIFKTEYITYQKVDWKEAPSTKDTTPQSPIMADEPVKIDRYSDDFSVERGKNRY